MATNKQMLREIVNEMKENSTHIASIKQLIKRQLNNGFNINTQLLRGRNIGFYMVKYNITGLALFLAKNGYNLNICNDQYDAPIHIAVRDNKIDLVKDLAKAGCDLNLGCEFEATPLHICAAEGLEKMALTLIKLGADPLQVDERNLTPLNYAEDEKNIKMINIFKKYSEEN